MISKIFSGKPQAIYMLHEGNSGSFSSNDGIALDPYAKLELIKSRPLPGMRLRETHSRNYNSQKMLTMNRACPLLSSIFGCNLQVLLELSDTDLIYRFALELASTTLFSLCDSVHREAKTRAQEVIEVIAQCMGLLRRLYEESVEKRKFHFRLVPP